MGLRMCRRCEATYLGTVSICVDCRLPLDELDEHGERQLSATTGDEPVAGGAMPDLADAVAYELDDWTDEQQAELSSTLVAEGIPYSWDGAELVVGEQHADVVEELIDGLDHPDAIEADADDGDDSGAELLSDLYVASDVLAGDPDNRAAVTELLEAGESLGRTSPPFGVDRSTWEALAKRVDTLAALLGDDAPDDEVVPAARAVRDVLRPLV